MCIWKNLRFFLLLALIGCGCAGVGEKPPSDDAKAFFVAGREADLLGLRCTTPQHIDLSAYTPFMGVKYPPTASVEVLSAPPSRPHQAFAVLQGLAPAAPPSQGLDPAVLSQFIVKAKAIGADALILCPPLGSDQPVKVEAVAIKYRREDPSEKGGRP